MDRIGGGRNVEWLERRLAKHERAPTVPWPAPAALPGAWLRSREGEGEHPLEAEGPLMTSSRA